MPALYQFYFIIIFTSTLSLYIFFPIVESSIALITPHELINGDAIENTAKIKYTVKNPFTIPYTNPPVLLNIFIIGRLPISSAANLTNNNANLEIININNCPIQETNDEEENINE